MAQKPSKRAQAAQKAAARAAATTTTVTVPEPFEPAPENLDDFLEVLDPERVYIVHVDRKDVGFKKHIFTVPILLHVAIVVGLAIRLYYILPHYLELFAISVGIPTAATVDSAALSDAELRNLTLRRAGMLAIDFVLFRYIGAWAWLFFIGDGFSAPDVSPARWRLALGYRPAEVVVRASRRWTAADLWTAAVSSTGPLDRDAPVLRDRLLPALDQAWMRDRTGYMMMGRDFELDFGAMLHAHDLLDRLRANTPRDFSLCVLARARDDAPGWLIWRIGAEDDDDDDDDDKPTADESGQASQGEAEARTRLEALRARLAAQDAAPLFYRFIEIVQYEATQPGGFTRARRRQALARARDAFEAAGVDFDAFVEGAGGVGALPGFDVEPDE